jgi:hypothetical protein
MRCYIPLPLAPVWRVAGQLYFYFYFRYQAELLGREIGPLQGPYLRWIIQRSTERRTYRPRNEYSFEPRHAPCASSFLW